MFRQKKKKTSLQTIVDATVIIKHVGTGAINNVIGKSDKIKCGFYVVFLLILALQIAFGLYDFTKTFFQISTTERIIAEQKREIDNLHTKIEEKTIYIEKLKNDSLTMETIARSFGMSKKGEKVFYFLD